MKEEMFLINSPRETEKEEKQLKYTNSSIDV